MILRITKDHDEIN